MADIGEGLKNKYGLKSAPTSIEIQEWADHTEKLIKSGYLKEQAGENAARVYLPGYRANVTKSDADTLQALLDAAKKKTSG